jgi:RNA polymerase sigma factor (sigma-70 family)
MKTAKTNAGKPALEDVILDTNFQNLLRNMARKFTMRYAKFGANAMIDVEDLVNEGMLAAATAYTSFDHKRGVLFHTHAYLYVQHAMDAYCRKFSHVLTISEKESRDHLGELNNLGVLRIDQESSQGNDFDIPNSSGMESSQCDVEDYFFAGFSTFEKNLARDNMVNGLSISELASKYNVSRSRVGVILQDLKDRMKDRAQRYVEED